MNATITVPCRSRRIAVVLWVACGLVAVLITINGGLVELLGYGMVPGALAAIAWAACWRPELRLHLDRLELANVWRTVTIPYERVDEVRSRWGLRVRADGRSYGSRAVAPRSRYRQDPLLHRGQPTHQPPDLLDAVGEVVVEADSEQVGRVIEVRASALRDRRTSGSTAATGPVRWRLNGTELGVVTGSVLAALVLLQIFG